MSISNINQWRKGPLSNKVLENGHGRGILCMALQNDILATGSSDHGIRVFDIKKNVFIKELYNKKYGHKEWVTSVSFLKDGRLLSSGMDSLLCLWDANSVKCDTFKAHGGSISKVMTDDHNIAITAGYDHKIMLWDLDNKKVLQEINAHRYPITEFQWQNSLVVSGDRNGVVCFSDINTGQTIQKNQSHKGQVSSILLYSDGFNNNQILSGGLQDGVICSHDMRSNKLVYQKKIHKAGINTIQSSMSSFIITGSADQSCYIMDTLNNNQEFGRLQASGSVYTVEIIGNLIISGNSDGNIQVFDTDKCLYGFGCMKQGGVTCIKATSDNKKLVVAGDDESPMILNY